MKVFLTALTLVISTATLAQSQPDNTNNTIPTANTIQSTDASGSTQTTVVDDNGNLKIVDKPQESSAPAPMPQNPPETKPANDMSNPQPTPRQ